MNRNDNLGAFAFFCLMGGIALMLFSFHLGERNAFGEESSAKQTQPQRILYLSLQLWDRTAETDAANVDALRADGLAWFTHVLIKVPSWQEQPNATEHVLVKHALNICRQRGIPVIWGRNLWVSWPADAGGPTPDAVSHYNPAHFSTAIGVVKAEGRKIGAVATSLDTEPYGQALQKSLKGVPLPTMERLRIRFAVENATAVAGLVDYIRPGSSGYEASYMWPFVGLGRLRLDSKTYYSKPPDWVFPAVNAPIGYEHHLDLWGCNVGLDQNASTLTPPEVRAWDLSAIQQRFAECRGLWVYVDADIFPDVIRAWEN